MAKEIMAQTNPESRISLIALVSPQAPAWFRHTAPLLDRLLGITEFDRIYEQGNLQDLEPFAFAEQGAATMRLQIRTPGADLSQRVPQNGPVIIVSNHPFGGVEALVLISLLRGVREDVKLLTNSGLRVFRELRPMIIGTNPLRKSQANLKSIKACDAHLNNGGLLVIFPAGKVSFCPRGEQRVRDAPWSRIVGYLARRSQADLLPVFFPGANSRVFQFLGKCWDRSKLLLLPREFLRMRGKCIEVEVGHAMPAAHWRHLDEEGITRFARFMTYALETPERPDRPAAAEIEWAPLAKPGSRSAIKQELSALPEPQHLLDYLHYSVFHARAEQIPVLMGEIARERERVFRTCDEGSGNPFDGDHFDEHYVQLFAWDNATDSLVGAYRMGPTDRLRQAGSSGLYLARMFEFDDGFYESMPPALELGRSFVAPEYQKNYQSLYMLWRGIGQYLVRHPRYRRLYGTVSLSKQYDARAVAVICDGLITPSALVRPKVPLELKLHPEWTEIRQGKGRVDLPTISACVRGLDHEGKDVPVLVRHYERLGAEFLCVGVDRHFNDTPGLLLRVDMERVAAKVLSTYLGEGKDSYLAWHPDMGAPGATVSVSK